MSAPPPGPIDGIWQLVRAEMDGEAAPELLAQKTMLELSNGRYAVRFDGVVMDRGTFGISESHGINSIWLKTLEGTNTGRTIPGIYQQLGEDLHVCYGLSGVKPLAFTSTTGGSRYLATYLRKQLT